MSVARPLESLLESLDGISLEVAAGLTREPKSLPPALLYDATGSALFEAITETPEYYLTRTERGILEARAADILARPGANLTLVELGAGTASKTGILIEALLRRQIRVAYHPIDVSATALAVADRNLRTRFPALKVFPLVADYTRALSLVSIPGRKLVLYLGSSIGNFERDAALDLLRELRAQLAVNDALLLGTDMVKPASVLVPAYNDHAQVTARFNLNLLARINRELGGGFDLGGFRHLALWNRGARRMEMYLESTRDQQVEIEALGLAVRFRAGERLHTENSYKYTLAGVRAMLAGSGFLAEQSWMDPRRWFALHLARAA